MKIILINLLLLFGGYVYTQPVIGFGAGYSVTAKAPVINIQAGIKWGKSHMYYNQIVHATTRSDVPQILGFRYGYNVGSFQPYIGYDYHMGSTDKVRNDLTRWDVAYGITKYFKSLPLMINIGKSGKYSITSIGIYRVV